MWVGKGLGAVAVVLGMGMMQQSAWAQGAPVSTPQLTDTPVAPPNTPAMRAAGIARDDSRHFGSAPDDPGRLATDLSTAATPEAVATAMRKVADWQLSQSQEYFSVFDRTKKLEGGYGRGARCTRGIWRRRRRWSEDRISRRDV